MQFEILFNYIRETLMRPMILIYSTYFHFTFFELFASLFPKKTMWKSNCSAFQISLLCVYYLSQNICFLFLKLLKHASSFRYNLAFLLELGRRLSHLHKYKITIIGSSWFNTESGKTIYWQTAKCWQLIQRDTVRIQKNVYFKIVFMNNPCAIILTRSHSD